MFVGWENNEKHEVDQSMLAWMLQFLFPGGKGEIEGYTVVEKPKQVEDKKQSTFTEKEKREIRSWLKWKE